MKLAFVLFLVNLSGFACDNCNIYLGINPNDFYHNFGIRFRTRFHEGTFSSTGSLMLKHGGIEPIYTNSTIRETYQRIELSGKYYWNPRWNTQIVAPYILNTQEINNAVEYFVQGVGDLTILQNYLLFNTKDATDSIRFKQRLSLGAGLKLPTGRINVERPRGVPGIDLQPGTGSWDGLASITYLAMYKQIGLTVNGNYKYNTFNHYGFKYGNTLNLTSGLFYLIPIEEKIQVMPGLGVYAEYFDQDYEGYERLDDSGGDAWMLDANLNFYLNKINLRFNYQTNITNNLISEQQIPTKWRLNLGVFYSFN